jgi:hypothetical protein
VRSGLKPLSSRGLDKLKTVSGEDRPRLGDTSMIPRVAFDQSLSIVQNAAIGQRRKLILIRFEQCRLNHLPERTELGMFVLGTGQRTKIKRGHMPCMGGLDTERFADGEREFGADKALVEQFAFEAPGDRVDDFCRTGKQPGHDQHGATQQILVGLETGQGQATFVGAEGYDVGIARSMWQALERVGKRRMQRPARAQQLSLVVERTDEDEIELADFRNVNEQIMCKRIGHHAGRSAIERSQRRHAGRFAFNRDKGNEIQGGTRRSTGRGRGCDSVTFTLSGPSRPASTSRVLPGLTPTDLSQESP